jgi:hypothetical protein
VKHGTKSRRKWSKRHLAVDNFSGMIVVQTLKDQDVDDPSQIAPLLEQIDSPVTRVTVDSAYDGAPPIGRSRRMAMTSKWPSRRAQRRCPTMKEVRPHSMIAICDHHRMGADGLRVATSYGRRSLTGTTIGRHKTLIGLGLRGPNSLPAN